MEGAVAKAAAKRERHPASRVEHLTPKERAARGKAARGAVPRASHSDWSPAADRRDPIEILQEQAATRLPELVPIRYGGMLVSPFTFYRGAAAIMAADLASTPRSGLTTQICGDAHLVIYRHQVIKQADVVLAMFLLGHEFSPEKKKRNFDYYDELT